jgi:dipeptidyl aminopeptidase/acylaminoacyl peptidase
VWLQNGFWAFSHNPMNYAKKITCPVLLFYGTEDVKASQEEINGIFNKLTGQKNLIIFQEAGMKTF